MKKKYILLGLSVFCLFAASCDNDNTTISSSIPTSTIPVPTTTPVETTPVDPVEKLGDIGFYSSDFAFDGEEHELVAKNTSSDYNYVYTDNKQSATGVYYPTCSVYDAKTNELIKTFKAVLTIDKPENQEFNAFLDEFFAVYLGDDYYAWNVFTYDSASLGFNREEAGTASWYSYSRFDEADKPEAYAEFDEIDKELEAFDTSTLSNSQMASYRVLDSFCDYYKELYNPENNYDPLIELRYVDSFGGYVANFADTMQGYYLRTEDDVKDVVDYINSTPDSFTTYVDYVKDRDEAGYTLSDTTLNEMTAYLDEITEFGTTYYLYEVLSDHIDSTTFLSTEQKTAYKESVTSALTNAFLPAVAELSTDLKEYTGKLTPGNEGYFAQYGENAQAYYELMLEDTLGIELDMEEFEAYLNTMISKYYRSYVATANLISGLSSSKRITASDYLNGSKSLVGLNTTEEMIEFLKVFAKTIVPDLDTMPVIHTSEMDSTVASITTTVAYYTKSTVDFMGDEYITVNPNYLGSDLNYTLSTLAHEGYPGHLYSYVHAKESNLGNLAVISGVTGQAEGWATYVQLKLYDYIIENYAGNGDPNKDPVTLVCKYEYYNQLINYLLEVAVDLGINYHGWNVDEVAEYLDDMGFNAGIAQDLFDQLIEMPTGYAPYGYGMSIMLDLHKKAQKELGEYYNEIDFNKNVVLKEGEAGLGRLTELTDAYIAQVKYIYGLD